MIEFNNVRKRYAMGIEALNGISFKIDRGEFVFLIGPSGAGKTTIVKLLLHEEKATSGKIIVNNKNITDMRSRKVPSLRKNIGVVFQDFRLLEDRNVYKNISFALDILGVSAREKRKKIEQALDLVGLKHKMKSFPHQLSGGEQQRVSMARAMVNNPDILIADEPTGNLDPETSWEIMNQLQKINDSGTTIIVVTHSKDIVDRLGKRVIQLSHGDIIRDGLGGYYHEEA